MTLKLQVELELTGFSSFYRVYLYSRGWYYLKLLGNVFQKESSSSGAKHCKISATQFKRTAWTTWECGRANT